MLPTNLMAATGWVHYSHYCSVAQSCPTLFNHVDCSTPGFPVLHHLPDPAQIHVHWVGDASQPSHPLSSPFPPALNLSQYQGLFPVSWLDASAGQSTGASASVFPKDIQAWFHLGLTGLISFQSKGLSRVFSSTTVRKHQFFHIQPYDSTLTSVRDYWKNHSFDYMDLCQQTDVSAF